MKKLLRKLSLLILLLPVCAGAQQVNLFLNSDYNAFTDKALNNPKASLHTGFKPLVQSQVDQSMSSDSVLGYVFPQDKKSWIYRKFYRESLINIKDTVHHFWCAIDPLFNFQLGEDKSDSGKKYYINTRGFLIQGGIGRKFSFGSEFFENQANYPYYINQYADATGIVPGQGRYKLLNPKGGGAFYSQGFDFSSATGYFTYAPCTHFMMQIGEGKNFIGDGYRSLLLSDNSFNYPYARFTTTFGHFQYTNLYAIFMNLFNNEKVLSIGTEGLFQRKAASFQYLSWNIIPQVEVGVFQGMIWQASDSNNKQHYNFNYFNPVIGANALGYGLRANNNVILGTTFKVKVCPYLMLYGQLVADDLSGGNVGSKTGYQAGFKFYLKDLEVQLEYNQVRPYTYAASDSTQNYTHYNQPLADPLGANFKELVAILHYRFLKHFAAHLQINLAKEGADSANTNYGSNLFVSDKTATSSTGSTGQGVSAKLNYIDFHLSYLLNPRTNMNLTLGITRRDPTYNAKEVLPSTTFFYIGFRTSINNIYMDF